MPSIEPKFDAKLIATKTGKGKNQNFGCLKEQRNKGEKSCVFFTTTELDKTNK
jgi:hypothetical protein